MDNSSVSYWIVQRRNFGCRGRSGGANNSLLPVFHNTGCQGWPSTQRQLTRGLCALRCWRWNRKDGLKELPLEPPKPLCRRVVVGIAVAHQATLVRMAADFSDKADEFDPSLMCCRKLGATGDPS
jgi:hypothetical protein